MSRNCLLVHLHLATLLISFNIKRDTKTNLLRVHVFWRFVLTENFTDHSAHLQQPTREETTKWDWLLTDHSDVATWWLIKRYGKRSAVMAMQTGTREKLINRTVLFTTFLRAVSPSMSAAMFFLGTSSLAALYWDASPFLALLFFTEVSPILPEDSRIPVFRATVFVFKVMGQETCQCSGGRSTRRSTGLEVTNSNNN